MKLLETTKSPHAKILAAWMLERQGKLSDKQVLEMLGDQNPHLREHAFRLAERDLDKREALYHYATNGFHEERDPRVRFQWALSLGNKYDLVTGVMLGLILRQDTADRWMRLAAQSSHPDNAGIVLNSLIRDSAKEDVNPQAMREMAALFAAEGGKHFEPDFRGILAEMGKKKRTVSLPLLAGLAEGLSRRGRNIIVTANDVSGHGGSKSLHTRAR